ncbi:gag-protease polyprotein [Cucumis melo var. makuwa]|uniref:Gag-protease polyprotein n=1 Tax=Cucumis melo var. makuwa TaxID=1194695 RepID=A0A5D3E493_CUCMM|nr:gag-protease polyprotein [Cucumis melo var. makuwa]TYK30706.1 gag-protease polyprotein [Cucumis melo var. makuwa]
MDNPTKAQMWLTSIETIFWYMKCPNDQKQGNMIVEQYDAEFDMLSHFASDVVRDEATRTKKFVRVDMSLHERANLSKTAGRHRQELVAVGKTLRELPVCRSCGRSHGGRCLVGSGVCFRCKQLGHTADFCPQKLLETTSNQTPTFQQGRVFATTLFLDELPRLLPSREIDFAIELEPDTAPISRASYRMASAELKELKVQLRSY